jgi:hypothetical protein
VFDMTIYQLSIRHLTIAATLLVILVWRMTDQGLPRTIWWRAWLLVIAICGLITAACALSIPFDTDVEAAALIRNLGLRDKTWSPFPHSAGQGVAALDGLMFERLEAHCSEDFIRWNSIDEHKIVNIDDLNIRLRKKVADDGRFYLLSPLKIPNNPPLIHQIAHVSRFGYDGQTYFMYVVGMDQPDARPHNQLCAGPHLPLRPR